MQDLRGLKIVFLFQNENQFNKIKSQILETLPSLPLEISIAKDPGQFLPLFERNSFDLVFIDLDVPNINFNLIISEVRKIKGSTGIFKFSTEKNFLHDSLDFELPITNWTGFINQLFGFIPEEMRIQYGLKLDHFVTNTIYLDYVKNLKKSDEDLEKLSITIPSHLILEEKNSNSNQKNVEALVKVSETQSINFERSRFEFVLASITYIVLVSFTFYAFYNPELESENVLSIRNISLVLSIFATLLYFTSIPFAKIDSIAKNLKDV